MSPTQSSPDNPPGAATWVVRVTHVKGPFTHVVGLPEEVGPVADALHFTQEGASRLAMDLCKLGWVAYAEPRRP